MIKSKIYIPVENTPSNPKSFKGFTEYFQSIISSEIKVIALIAYATKIMSKAGILIFYSVPLVALIPPHPINTTPIKISEIPVQ